MPPPLQPETQPASSRRMYDARAQHYDDSHHPAFATRLLALANPQPGQRILDLACGTGLVTIPAARAIQPGGAIVGVDVSSGMLREARRKLETLDAATAGSVTLAEHSIAELETLAELEGTAGTFDAVTCASALVLLEEPEAAMARWSRYLKGGGVLVVDVPHPRNQRVAVVLERVCKELGVATPYNRAWVTSEESLPNLIRKASGGELDVEEIVVVDPIAGYGTRYFDAGEDEASARFDEFLQTEPFRGLREGDEDTRARVKRAFIEAWSRAAGDNGKVEDVDAVYVAVAKKSKS